MGFPGSSAGKESTCNAGDPGSILWSGRSPGEGRGYQRVENPDRDLGSIPGLGRSPGERKGYPLQYSSLDNSTAGGGASQAVVHGVAKSQIQTGVRSLGWEDPLEKGKVTHSSILAWRIPWTV